MSSQTIKLSFDVPLQPARTLSVGSLQCMYETGNLRYIKWNGKEVIRMIYGAVRDKRWQTAVYTIIDEVIEESDKGFLIKYTALYELDEIRYKGHFEIEIGKNTISFAMKGVALKEFQANRIGICVLHPVAGCAGREVLIKQTDGNILTSVFPKEISPHQPFKDICEMSWITDDGVEAGLTFEGDTFETEDQRNWTDDSYKTYSRPLDLPYPYDVAEGDITEQKVFLKLLEIKNKNGQASLNTDIISEKKVPFPRIGYSRTKGSGHLKASEIELLKNIPFNQYRVEIHPDEKEWKTELASAVSECRLLFTKLELVVFFGTDSEKEVDEFVGQIAGAEQFVDSILVLDHTRETMPHDEFDKIYNALKRALPSVKIGYGTNKSFASLNRSRPAMKAYDFVCFSVNPQVHATDTRSLIENLSAQEITLETARTFVAEKPIHVSPVTFKTRSGDGEDVDDRLHTYFGVWWTLQTIKNLYGADLTFYETVGKKGIIKTIDTASDGNRSPEKFLTPLYEALTMIHHFQPVYLVVRDGDINAFTIENKSGDRLTFVLQGNVGVEYTSVRSIT